MKFLLLLLLLLLPLLCSGATLKSPQAILNAVETLSNSGYNAMSLTIQLILTDSSLPLQTTSTKSPSETTTLTIFTPPDSSFQISGQPSLSHLLLHFSPLSLSLTSLSSLPLGTKIPTLSPSLPPLIITSKPHSPHLSINNINLLGSPLFDDGNVVVFAIQDFFPANFTFQENTPQSTPPQCSDVSPFSTLFDASSKLKSRGYSIMASFLELQLIGYLKLSPAPLELTMFAPQDDVLISFSGDVPTYAGLLMKHILPCRLSYADLNGIKNGTIFKDNFEGLSTMFERTETDFFVNGVQITFPDMYSSDSLVVHGISGAITGQPDDTVQEEEVEKGDAKKEDEHSVSSVSYSHRASGPNGNEL